VARPKTIAIWVVSGLLALTFLLTGFGKLAGMPPSPENFARWGYSTTFMRLIGAVEVAGGAALLVPRVAPLAALLLGATMLGAIKTGVVFHEPLHIALPAVLLVLLGVIVWGRVTK
jgi:uncharacterized membrane protein YphA (DoxX/SURF4 family)